MSRPGCCAHSKPPDAIGSVSVLGASVHVVAQGDPRQVARVLAERNYAFVRDLKGSDGLAHRFRVRLGADELDLLVLHPDFAEVPA